MLKFAGADTKGEGSERSLCRGMAVAAHQRGARQREALLGSDDMDDALFGICIADVANAESGGVRLRLQLARAFHVHDGHAEAESIRTQRGRQIMVRYRQRQVGATHRGSPNPEPVKGLGAHHLVNEMPSMQIRQVPSGRRLTT